MSGYQGYPSSTASYSYSYPETSNTSTASANSTAQYSAAAHSTAGPAHSGYGYSQYPAYSNVAASSPYFNVATTQATTQSPYSHLTSQYATTSAYSNVTTTPATTQPSYYSTSQYATTPVYGTASTHPSSTSSPYTQSLYPKSSTTAPTATGAKSSVAALTSRFGQPAQSAQARSTMIQTAARDREIYILSYPSGTFKSHWALWIPRKDANLQSLPEQKKGPQGMLIHVKGSLAAGFKHEFQRASYGPQSFERPWYKVLGRIREEHLTDGPTTGTDSTAYNTVETLALSIPAPGPSLNSAMSPASGLRPEIRDCQWWLKQLIDQLIQRQMLHPDASKIVAETPIQWA